MLFQKLYRGSLWMGIVSFLAACTNPTPVAAPEVPAAQPQPQAQGQAPSPQAASEVESGPPRPSTAKTPREYRRDGATHLYAKNSKRIFVGKLPPMLHAIGVLQVDINQTGAVTALRWMRAPSHAPDVVAEIERAVRSASPFPAPTKLGKVTYTDTWLWDKSGRFQLDTLTEGQL
jgi:protein TonB